MTAVKCFFTVQQTAWNSETTTNEVNQQHLLIWVILNINLNQYVLTHKSMSGLEEHGCDICQLKTQERMRVRVTSVLLL